MADIKETTELLDALQNLANEVEADSEDGKLSVLELLGNYPEIMNVINEGGDYNTIIEEMKDLDEQEILVLTGKLITFVFTILEIVKNLKGE